jgi:multimeric flavodoxin WrbA
MRTVIIMGSARSDGDTKNLVNELAAKTGWHVIDLNNYSIAPYDYNKNNHNDDYLPLIKNLIEQYDVFVLATPVYWYAMSSTMKAFLDRFTDLLTIEKDLGRKLRDKKMAVITTSTGENLGDNFWLPFVATASYLGMDYLGNTHTIAGSDNDALLQNFIETIDALIEMKR